MSRRFSGSVPEPSWSSSRPNDRNYELYFRGSVYRSTLAQMEEDEAAELRRRTVAPAQSRIPNSSKSSTRETPARKNTLKRAPPHGKLQAGGVDKPPPRERPQTAFFSTFTKTRVAPPPILNASSSSARPPSAVLMRPQSLQTPSPSSSSRNSVAAEPDPFVTQAHKILRPSSQVTLTRPPSIRVGSLVRRPSSAARRPSSIFTHFSSKRRTQHVDDIPLRPTSSSSSSIGSFRLLTRSSATSRRHRVDLARQASFASVSVYSNCTDPELLASPRMMRQYSNKDSAALALRRKASVYSSRSSSSGRPKGFHDLDSAAEDRTDDELLRHWTTFVSSGSPLIPSSSPLLHSSPVLPSSSPPYRHPSPAPTPSPRPTAFSPANEVDGLPRTTVLLRSRARALSAFLLSPSPSSQFSASPSGIEGMTRVDSEVLSARFALKRLGSTGFAGDALDTLGRGEEDADPPRQRSSRLIGEAAKGAAVASNGKPWWDDVAVMSLYNGAGEDSRRPKSTPSPSSSLSSLSSLLDDSVPWKRRGRPRSSMSTTRTSISLDALELDLGKFERELELDIEEADEAAGAAPPDDYVCVWDLIEVEVDDPDTLPQSPPPRLPSSSSLASATSTAPTSPSSKSKIPRLATSTQLATPQSPVKLPPGCRQIIIPPTPPGESVRLSLDITTAGIAEAYDAVCSATSRTDFMILGYRKSRDKLHLYSTGEKGLEELKTKLVPGEIHFGMLKLEGRLLQWTYLPEDTVSGVQRARALVHSRAVAASFRAHQATLTAANLAEFSASAVRQKLKLDGTSSLPPSPLPTAVTQFARGGASPPISITDPDEPPPVPVKNLSRGMEGLGITEDGASRKSISPPMSPNTTLGSSPRGGSSRNGSPQLHAPPPRTSSNPNSPPVAHSSSSPRDQSSPRNGVRTSPTPSPVFANARNGTSSPTTGYPASVYSNASVYSTDASPRPDAEAHQATLARIAEEEKLEAERRAHLLQEEEDARRAEREKKEREAAALARQAAEKEARAKWEADQRERERLDSEERVRLEKAELARRDAGDRLRREEQRHAEAAEQARIREEEAKRLEVEEKARLDEEARTKEAKEELRRMIEQEREDQKQKAEAEAREQAEAREGEKRALVGKFEAAAKEGGVLLTGHVTVQGGNSVYWKRRWFELRSADLKLYKSQQDTVKPLEEIGLMNRVRAITDNPEEADIANSFKLSFKGEDDDADFLFYTDEREDKDLLVSAIRIAAQL